MPTSSDDRLVTAESDDRPVTAEEAEETAGDQPPGENPAPRQRRGHPVAWMRRWRENVGRHHAGRPAPESPAAPDADEPAAADQAREAAAPPDPWSAFAPAAQGKTKWIERGLDVVDRVAHHEWFLAPLASLGLAIAMTWPVALHPTRAIAGVADADGGLGEPATSAWQLAWAGKAITSDPGSLWQGNLSQPGGYGYPLDAPLLGYAPLGMVDSGSLTAAILRYNIIFVLAFALATLAGYALVRQLGAGRVGAIVAGAAVAYAPWRLGQAGHLEAISTGGAVLALAMLARGHGWSLSLGYRPGATRPGWVIAAWLVAAWQFSMGWSVGVPFAYVLALILVIAVAGWLFSRRPKIRWLVLAADAVGIAIFAATVAALGYLNHRAVAAGSGLRVSREALSEMSPPWRGFLTAPKESLLWGHWHDAPRAALSSPSAMAMLPGYFVAALAIAGLAWSIWKLAQRLVLLVCVALSIIFAMGTAGPENGHLGYQLLTWNFPGFDYVRAPNWIVAWTTLLLAVLAAGAVTAIGRWSAATAELTRGRRARAAGRWALRLAALVPIALVLAEGLPSYRATPVERVPAALSKVLRDPDAAPVLVLPANDEVDGTVALWTVGSFPRVANGGEQAPPRVAKIREAALVFPDQSAVDVLRESGINTVVVLRDTAARAGYSAAARGLVDEAITEVGVTVEERRDVIIYHID